MTAINLSRALALVLVLISCVRTDAASEYINQASYARPAVDPNTAAVVAFRERLKEYVAFHNKIESTIPKLDETANPEKIATREKALGEALVQARPNARPGEYLIKEVQPHITKIIQKDFALRPLADRKALIVELPKNLKVGVNMIYPTSIPLATFPPKLLQVMPDLPPELEYRIVGRHLILRDTKASVIVDVMPDVFPIPR